MVVFKKTADIREYLQNQRFQGRQVGFVPTMGALHEGHISLIDKAKNDGMLVITSIFVNPTQFNVKEDFEKYPVSTANDILLLLNAGCDVLFIPTVGEMYPAGTDEAVTYHFGSLENILEGAHRPGHFNGVGQIIEKLLDIVSPKAIYMGRKDYQQCLIVKNLIKQLNRENEVTLDLVNTKREPDGLAMSSRNRRLTEPQRAVAGLLYQCLVSIQAKQETDSFAVVQKECIDILQAKGFEVDYVTLADAEDLSIFDDYNANRRMIALIAASVGKVRLIDNLIVNP